MARVGIMSMQRIFNYGSSLQAYGLRRLIESVDVDVSVDFLDYRAGDPLVSEGRPTQTSRVGRAVSKFCEYHSVGAKLSDRLRFFNHKMTYGAKYFPELGIPGKRNHAFDVDVQVIGSDEVFNCVQANARVGYSRDLFGHGATARRILSFAGSFGNTTIHKIEKAGIRADLEQDFSRFDAISVRDRNSASVVHALTGTRPELHVDPALAYDYMALEGRIPKERLCDDRYLVVYGYSGRLTPQENEVLAQHARRRGAKILCFGGVQDSCDRFVDCSPFELLAYFRDAEAVITDTFHGTIFAMINNRPFASIVRSSVGERYGNEEKLGFLLESFGLESQRVADMANIARVLDNCPDYRSVNALLARERCRATAYLAREVRLGAST